MRAEMKHHRMLMTSAILYRIHGTTPLVGNTEAVALLLTKRGNPYQLSNAGLTALQVATAARRSA